MKGWLIGGLALLLAAAALHGLLSVGGGTPPAPRQAAGTAAPSAEIGEASRQELEEILEREGGS